MKTIMRTLTITLLMSTILITAKAQEDKGYIYKPFQVTFVPNLGTNGELSQQCVNKISLNLLIGSSAGLQGVEFGGIGNIEKDFANGMQYAGIFNSVGGPVNGIQLSGFFNFVKGDLNGIQFAEFGNFNGSFTNGIQIAGFMNTSKSLKGIQGSGFMNITDDVLGVQGSSFMNIADRARGFQGSGFMNIAGEAKGAQAASFLNIADRIEGAQLSGFLNIADKVKGLQLGIINICDSLESGVPIGLINVVGNGYHAIELSASETWNLQFAYRLGIDKFYTQFLLAGQWLNGEQFWGAGFGLGTRFRIINYLTGSVDLLSYQIMEHKWYSEHFNSLSQARITVEGKIAGKLKWFAGPTFNILWVPFEYPEPDIVDHFAPWTVYDNASGISYIKMWPGISAGLRF